jgi:phosphoribosylaminoimidazole (AIR) synthetase
MDDDGAKAVDLPITEDQVGTLRDHIVAVGADEAKFLKYLKVESLEEIMSSQFLKAVNALKAKEKKGKS